MGEFLALAYKIMVLLNPLHYVVNLVRKTSALTFISDNNIDYFVLILPKSNSKEGCIVMGFFYKLEIKFCEDVLSAYLGLITLSPVSSTELQVGNHKCTITVQYVANVMISIFT